ncbi:hypothetical protein P0D69_08425 [Paraburkholderia sediminicola]|uniref:hypothetical protein n=1 Tax=Paraburkholderia sediminicola TaxID=458836 RepID=UPI0038BC4729
MLNTDTYLTLKRSIDNVCFYIWITNESVHGTATLSAMSMRSSYPRNLTKTSEQVIHSFANRATMPPSQPRKGSAIGHPSARFLADMLGLDFLNSKTMRRGNAANWLANGDDLLNWLERCPPGFR